MTRAGKDDRSDDGRADGGSGLREVAGALLRRYRIVLLATAAGLVTGLILFRLRPVRYEAAARLLIEPRRSGLPSADNDSGMILYFLLYRNELKTQLLLVKSRPVAERVVNKLDLASAGPVKGSTALRMAFRSRSRSSTRCIPRRPRASSSETSFTPMFVIFGGSS